VNTLKKDKESKEAAPREERRGKLRGEISSVLTGEAFSRDNILKNLPFLFYLTLLMVVYIGYGYYASRTSRNIHDLEAQKQDLFSDAINEQANLNLVSMPSQIADSTAAEGLKPSMEPPVKIKVNPIEYLVRNE
jgi:hypothetical protein